ncbi:MAG: hypothetical protein WC319_14950 [Candidatus Paceibacterota bacterium]|jgi:hypothetical protein
MKAESIQLLRKIESKVPHINSGGCAIFMLALYHYLKKTEQLVGDEKFVYLYNSYEYHSFKRNRKYLNNEKGVSPTSCSHAVLFHDGKYWDSSGGTVDKPYPIALEIPLENEAFIYDSISMDAWNPSFDRETGIKAIESVLNVKINLNFG